MGKIKVGEYRFASDEVQAVLVKRALSGWLFKAGVGILVLITVAVGILVSEEAITTMMPEGSLSEKQTIMATLALSCLFFYVLIESKASFNTVVQFENGHTICFSTLSQRECEILKDHIERLVDGASVASDWTFEEYPKHKVLPVVKKNIVGVGFGKIDALSETVAMYASLGGLAFLGVYTGYHMFFEGKSFGEVIGDPDDLGVWLAVIMWLIFEAAKWVVNERLGWLMYLSADGDRIQSHKEIIKRLDVRTRYEDTVSKVYHYDNVSS